ncbi:MAG: TlyA family RNA methyltransferase [Sulfurospirillaceae bacterium]|nr:TlyA family RNA methyltransferase [Sulfurospirillaceae bacterium]MDD3462929.1 TlyA family RNA methyltransferase [Sulfurospirillaceae bacterium]
MRLDQYLVSHHQVESRNKASEYIKEGSVYVNNSVVRKPSFDVQESDVVDIQKMSEYVSRGGLKLRGFLQDVQSLSVENLECLDIGSSTGGFVQVLIEEGAMSVTAVDVGTNQLHNSLRLNPKVFLYEQTDIRAFCPSKQYDIVTCDVSFIGIAQILQDIDRLAKKDIILLFKPQFEVGKDVKRTTKGVVKDMVAIKRAQDKFVSQAVTMGWSLVAQKESVVKGKEGNAETFYYFEKR